MEPLTRLILAALALVLYGYLLWIFARGTKRVNASLDRYPHQTVAEHKRQVFTPPPMSQPAAKGFDRSRVLRYPEQAGSRLTMH